MTRPKRWVVRAGDGQTVAEIVERAREHGRAIDEGRVFLGRRRVTSGTTAVRIGDEITIGAPEPRAGAIAAALDFRVLWERDGLVACEKPAGMPTVADHEGASHALVARAAARIGRSANELFVSSRLDREVSGIVIFATTEAAAGRLRQAREDGRYVRRYVAIATGALSGGGVWDAPVGEGKDARHRAAFGPSAKPSLTRWSVVARAGDFSLLSVEPQTGRTHQIRVHASHAGAPLLGDRDYGGPARVTLPDGGVVSLSRIALHAARVIVEMPASTAVAAAEVPASLKAVWSDLGGAPEAWDRAVSCVLGT